MFDRKIIHIDMDAFYASVEQLDNPALRNKAVAVGGSSDRGVVAAASYEARKYGVKSALSSKIALKRCPHLIFVKPRFERYREVSQQIREIFRMYTDQVEPLSLDEAYLDVTTNKQNQSSATLIAKEIRAEIWEQTGLKASAGISYNKFIAKIASDINKPNGQKTVTPEEAQAFLDALVIDKFYGVGKVTSSKMHRLGIFTGKDLRNKDLGFLVQNFGNSGQHFYNIARGIHHSPVNPNRLSKSVGGENTFSENIVALADMEKALIPILDKVVERLNKKNVKGRTITLKIKYEDFSQHTRSITLNFYTRERKIIWENILQLLHKDKITKAVRLLGISLSNLDINQDFYQGLQLELEFKEFG